eukprot:675294-Alexandrium_andersonii.AAC.1
MCIRDSTDAFFRDDLEKTNYHVGRVSRLVGKGTDFVIHHEAHCWEGSESLWNRQPAGCPPRLSSLRARAPAGRRTPRASPC